MYFCTLYRIKRPNGQTFCGNLQSRMTPRGLRTVKIDLRSVDIAIYENSLSRKMHEFFTEVR